MEIMKKSWAGIPFKYRYSDSVSAPRSLVKEMRRIEDSLDLKFFLPTERWHVVRYPQGRDGEFIRVWECDREPGMWIIDALHWGDLRKRNLLKEVEDWEAEQQAKADRDLQDHIKDVSKDLAKCFSDWHDFGGQHDTHMNFASAEVKSAH